MKICFTSYYGLRDALLCAGNALTQLGCVVCDFHLLEESQKNNDYEKYFVDFINTEKVSVILWWYINIPTTKMEYIVNNTHAKHIYFNWDEPYNWPHCDIQNKCKFIDHAFVCCTSKMDDYIKFGTKYVHWLPPCHDPKINNVLVDDNIAIGYDCDISFICTNLYTSETDYPEQLFNRKK